MNGEGIPTTTWSTTSLVDLVDDDLVDNTIDSDALK